MVETVMYEPAAVVAAVVAVDGTGVELLKTVKAAQEEVVT